MKTLFLESVAGVAGDMFTAAFVDAGLLAAERAQEVPRLLGLEGVEVEVARVHRAALAATHVVVRVEAEEPGHDHDHGHAHYPQLDGLLHASALPPAAKAFARKVYRLLAEAEARAHGCDVEKVSFHEVGDLDSVVDVAMAGLCVAEAAPQRVLASPVLLGRGTVGTRHGTYPVPPPAAGHLALGMPVAPVPGSIQWESVELSTPTGLAILRALQPEFRSGWPEGVVRAQGFGAGSMDLGSHPNVFRVVLLEEADAPVALEGLPYERGTVTEIECNVDDQTGERSGWLIQRALELGALDAWMTPVVGKKGRPALCFTLLAQPATAPGRADWLLRSSSTFGLRYSERARLLLSRTVEARDTPRGKVRFSVGHTTEGEKVKEKPEFDDLAEIWKDDPDFRP
ncbi:MAG: LarC family nickel insertion protein [Gemmatimonadetes bacterium]|nr:LarC family nickel insertion protein [Gemmatimonadota bacterium]